MDALIPEQSVNCEFGDDIFGTEECVGLFFFRLKRIRCRIPVDDYGILQDERRERL